MVSVPKMGEYWSELRAKQRMRAANLRASPEHFTKEQAPLRKKTALAVNNLIKHKYDSLEDKINLERNPGLKTLNALVNIHMSQASIENVRTYLRENEGGPSPILPELYKRLDFLRKSFSQKVATLLTGADTYKFNLEREINDLHQSMFPLIWTILNQSNYYFMHGIYKILDSKLSKRRELFINNLLNVHKKFFTGYGVTPILVNVTANNGELKKLRKDQARYLAMMGKKYVDNLEQDVGHLPERRLQLDYANKSVAYLQRDFGIDYVTNFMKDLYSMGQEAVTAIMDFQQAKFSLLQVDKNVYDHDLFLEMEVFYRAARTFEFTGLKRGRFIPLGVKQFFYRHISNTYISPIKALHQEVLHTMRGLTYGEDWFDRWITSDIPEQSGEFLKKYRGLFSTTFTYWTTQVEQDMTHPTVKS